MTVYTRGYRPYHGELRGAPAFWVIAREGLRAAWERRWVRFLAIMFLLWFTFAGVVLYMELSADTLRSRFSQSSEPVVVTTESTRTALFNSLSMFYGGISVLGALVAVMIGTGLISSDLRHKSLSLYLVRPIRPLDYALGKALTIPLALVPLSLLPGVAYYLLASAWQEPGNSLSFFQSNTDILVLVAKHFFIAAASYSGLMLITSSRTPRTGAVTGMTAALLFGGTMLAIVGGRLRGTTGQVLRHLGLPENAAAPFIIARIDSRIALRRGSSRGNRRVIEALPSVNACMIIAACLLALGIYLVYRRARTAEVVA